MLIPSDSVTGWISGTSLSRRVNANSQQPVGLVPVGRKLIKKGEC